MRYLNVGIAYEGGNDGEVIAVISRRVLEKEGCTFEYFNPETPSTMIIPYVQVYTQNFIESGVDLGIFCTDQDKSPTSRIRDMEKEIEKIDPTFIGKAAIAIPNPHIEAWLLLDDAPVKQLLGISGSATLNYGDYLPKDQLTALYNDSESYIKSQNQLRIEIAERMNIELCCRKDNNFKRFVEDLQRIARI